MKGSICSFIDGQSSHPARQSQLACQLEHISRKYDACGIPGPLISPLISPFIDVISAIDNI